jgi:hypothetical protein
MRVNLKRSLAAAAASAACLVTALTVTAAPAEAICKGIGLPSAAQSYVNDRLVAVEGAQSGTCDGDGIYNGYIIDPRTDGYAARIRYSDGSYNAIVAYASSGTPVNYRFYDQTGNTSAKFQLYANPAHRPTYWADTWGY